MGLFCKIKDRIHRGDAENPGEITSDFTGQAQRKTENIDEKMKDRTEGKKREARGEKLGLSMRD